MMNSETRILPVITPGWTSTDDKPAYTGHMPENNIAQKVRDPRLVAELQEQASAWLRLSEKTSNPKFKAEYLSEYNDILAAIKRRLPPANFSVVEKPPVITSGWILEKDTASVRPPFDTRKANQILTERRRSQNFIVNSGLRALAWMRTLGI